MCKSALGLLAATLSLTALAESPYAFRERLLEVHPHRVPAKVNIVALTEDPVVRHAATDFADFCRGGTEGDVTMVEIGIAPETDPLTSRITVTNGIVRVTGATPKEAYQGVCRLEDEILTMGSIRALKSGSRTYTRMFSPRMTHSGYEVETFPDAYLDRIAHSGMDAIMVFIEDPPDVTRNGKVDMNALVKRCAERGIDVWAYADFPKKAAKMHPLDPGAKEWYDATYGAVVKNCPGLKGLICVGESCGFPSRDPGMGGYWFQPGWEKLGTKLNGFWPVSDWPDWINLVKQVTRQYQPNFEIVFWTYNWFKKPAEIRLPLIEKLPTDITLLVTWVRGDKPTEKCGVPAFITDYSITGPGPSAVFRSEADIAVRRGIPVMTISNTGGRTWDSGVAPYVPVPNRWRGRFWSLREGQQTWGLKALMESHHYGFMPNFISDLSKLAFTREVDEAAYQRGERAILEREFGPKAVDAAMRAFAKWDAAFEYHQTSDRDFWGPLRVGPSYPFYLPGEKMPPAKKVEWKYMMKSFSCPTNEIAGNLERADREIALLKDGAEILSAALKDVPNDRRESARRILGVGKFYQCSVTTLRNVYAFYGAALVNDRKAMIKIIDDERDNVLAALPLVDFDSSLGWEPTMGYVANREELEHKLENLKTLQVTPGKWERPRTTHRNLHGPLSERLYVLWEEGRVSYGEMTHQHDFKFADTNLIAHGFWLVHGPKDVSFDCYKAENEMPRDGTPVHGLVFRDNGLETRLTACVPFGRKSTAHVKLEIRNPTSTRLGDSYALSLRTGREKRILEPWMPDIYHHYTPEMSLWLKPQSTWREASEGLWRDGDRFLAARGDFKPRFDVEKGAARFEVMLEPGETKALDLALGRGETVWPDFATAKAKVTDEWAQELSVMKLPPKLAADAERARITRNLVIQILQMMHLPADNGVEPLLPRQGCMRRGVWPWENKFAMEALDNLGFGSYVDKCLSFFFDYYQSESGRITPFFLDWAGNSAAVLYTFATHCLATGNIDDWLRYRDRAFKTFDWICRTRAKSAEDKRLIPGFFPPMRSSDWSEQIQHWAGTDLINLDGLERFSQAAARFNDPRAGDVQRECKDYRATFNKWLDLCRAKYAGTDEFRVPIVPNGKDAALLDSHYPNNHHGKFAERGLLTKDEVERAWNYRSRRGLLSEKGLCTLFPHGVSPDKSRHQWYTSIEDYCFFVAWKRLGRSELAEHILNAQIKYSMTEECYMGERYHDDDPWFFPWCPNSSANGRLLMMFLLDAAPQSQID